MIDAPDARTADDKCAALAEWLIARKRVLIGFSGGVDSAFLAVAAVDALGSANTLAVMGVSAAVPAELRARAHALAVGFGVPFHEIVTHELDDANYVANRGDRCFYCKRELWNRLAPLAGSRGMTLVDGTITDDLGEHRPGHAAGVAMGIESPLAACGFTKRDVREAARARSVPLWDAPASPCLSSRLATGVTVTRERLAVVERAEASLRALGITGDLRVRHLGDAARVELAPDLVAAWLDPVRRATLSAAVRDAGFARVYLDAHGYERGALQHGGERAMLDITGDTLDAVSAY